MKKKGVTLIELIVSMGILTIILASITTVMTSTSKTYNKATSLSGLQSQSIVFSTIISNQLKNSNDVTVYESVPSSFDEEYNYIYYNAIEKSIYKKFAGETSALLYRTANINQSVEFSKIDRNNVSVNVVLDNGDLSYENKFGVFFVNIKTGETIKFDPSTATKGICIKYKLSETVVANTEPCVITAFGFLASNGTNSEFITTDIVATIDEANKKIVVSPLTIVGEYRDISLVPYIEYAYPDRGDTLVAKDINTYVNYQNTLNPLGFYKNGVNKDVTITVKSGVAGVADATYDVEFEITVEPSPVVFPKVTSHDIVSTDGGTTKKMPSEASYLTANYKYTVGPGEDTPTGQTIRWYAVSPSEIGSVDDFNSKYKNGDFTPFATIDNNVSLKLSDYRDMVVGKYVFYDVVLKKDIYSSAPTVYDSAIEGVTATNCPYVFVGLDNGKIYETTLNEIDYIKSSQIQKNVMNICFNRLSKATKNKYIQLVFEWNVKDVYSQNEILGLLKVKIPSGNSGHSYTVDFVNKKLTIAGASYQYLNKNNIYPDISSSSLYKYAQYGLLSINMYDSYYTDKRTVSNSSKIRISFDGNSYDAGGISIIPNLTSSLTTTSNKLYSSTLLPTYFIKIDCNKADYGNSVKDVDILGNDSLIYGKDYSGSLAEAFAINSYNINQSTDSVNIDINTRISIFSDTMIGTWASGYNGSNSTITITGITNTY